MAFETLYASVPENNIAPVYGIDTGKAIKKSRLTGPVWTDKPHNHAGLDLKINLIKGGETSESFFELFCLE